MSVDIDIQLIQKPVLRVDINAQAERIENKKGREGTFIVCEDLLELFLCTGLLKTTPANNGANQSGLSFHCPYLR